ncbi:nucleotidyl transferase AbiEii/AbiGii toxin family protein [Parasphingorhabdus sp.]|uniref:nucleotidyl transferase AbiEii/AbiGii toxin family protein n=1 Tax=Parasphingorhabdus sp. TaxID=2709688 RepID=UPI003A8FF013
MTLENTITVEINEWIDKAKADPKAYMERQATEVFLTALGMTKPYAHEIYLKGGVLMGVVYNSPRQTGDIDFTAISDPDPKIADEIREKLNASFPRAAAELGYPTLMCAIQSSRYYPSEKMFPKATGPALKLHVGYAHRGSPQEKGFERGKATDILEIDISFREPVNAIQLVRMGKGGGEVHAYSLSDLIAEKLRALLQQEKRNRNRRQDIYDVDSLIGTFTLNEQEKESLLKLLRIKCKARDIEPERNSLGREEIRTRAQKEWQTMKLEIGEVPDFDECFERVNDFYYSLPWSH